MIANAHIANHTLEWNKPAFALSSLVWLLAHTRDTGSSYKKTDVLLLILTSSSFKSDGSRMTTCRSLTIDGAILFATARKCTPDGQGADLRVGLHWQGFTNMTNGLPWYIYINCNNSCQHSKTTRMWHSFGTYTHATSSDTHEVVHLMHASRIPSNHWQQQRPWNKHCNQAWFFRALTHKADFHLLAILSGAIYFPGHIDAQTIPKAGAAWFPTNVHHGSQDNACSTRSLE
jgi:hypothetical protein